MLPHLYCRRKMSSYNGKTCRCKKGRFWTYSLCLKIDASSCTVSEVLLIIIIVVTIL
jgi:hypothetical protein